MPSVSVRECKTSAEVFENYREVRKRMHSLKVLAPKVAEAPRIADKTPSETCGMEMMLISGFRIDSIDPNWGMLRRPRSSLKAIVECVAAFYGIRIPELLSSRRHAALVWPRQVAAYLAKHLTIRSFSEIGEMLHRDHSTIIHSVRKAEYWIAHDPERADEVEYLRGILAAASSSAP